MHIIPHVLCCIEEIGSLNTMSCSASDWQSGANSPSTPGISRLAPKSTATSRLQSQDQKGNNRLQAISWPNPLSPERRLAGSRLHLAGPPAVSSSSSSSYRYSSTSPAPPPPGPPPSPLLPLPPLLPPPPPPFSLTLTPTTCKLATLLGALSIALSEIVTGRVGAISIPLSEHVTQGTSTCLNLYIAQLYFSELATSVIG